MKTQKAVNTQSINLSEEVIKKRYCPELIQKVIQQYSNSQICTFQKGKSVVPKSEPVEVQLAEQQFYWSDKLQDGLNCLLSFFMSKE